MRKAVLLGSFALLILLAIAAPAFACPTKQSFSFKNGEVSVPNLTVPSPTVIPTKTGEFILGSYATDYGYGSILGYQTFSEEDWLYINLSTLTGYGRDTITSSTSIEQDVYTINGLSSWTYTGPTYTYNGPTCDAATHGALITTGEVFYGLLTTGTGIVHYTSGPLAGETAVDTWAGVGFPDNSGIYGATNYVH